MKKAENAMNQDSNLTIATVDLTSLTARDIAFLQLVASGMSSIEISRQAGMTINEVIYVKKKITQKTKTRNIISLLVHAVMAGVIRLDNDTMK